MLGMKPGVQDLGVFYKDDPDKRRKAVAVHLDNQLSKLREVGEQVMQMSPVLALISRVGVDRQTMLYAATNYPSPNAGKGCI